MFLGAPLPVLTQKVSVLIGGLPAAATYAGPAPGMVNGVIQMNVRIPDLVASSPVTPLLVRVGNSESQPGVLLATGSVAQYRRARGRVRIANNTVVADDGVLLRGGHVALPAGSTQYANFNDDPNSWTRSRDNYNLNLVRLVCYRLPIPNWAGQAFTVDEIIPHIDKAVDNAEAAGIYIIVDYHPVGGYDANDARDFWTKVAPRYKDRTHVLYEVTNEPFAWYPDTYARDQSALVSYEGGMYQLVRSLAPATHIILWSLSNIASSTPGAVAALVDKGSGILYDNASVGFHPYQWDAGVIDQLTRLRQKYPVFDTEFESEVFYSAPPATIQQMEQLGISWVWLGDKLFAGGSSPAPWPQPFWPRDPAAVSVDAGLLSGGIPSNGLRLWLKADAGVNVSGSGVADWADQSGANLSSSQPDASRRPTLVSGDANGQPAVVFDGVGQFLNLPLAVEGWSDATMVLVSANTADRDGGASRSESAAIFWDETLPWASTYLSPFQSRVNFRFGTTQQGNYPAYLRPSSVGSSYTLSVAVKAGTTDSLYVNGTMALAETGKQTTIHGTVPTGVLGKVYNGTFFPGGIAEVDIIIIVEYSGGDGLRIADDDPASRGERAETTDCPARKVQRIGQRSVARQVERSN